jgi:tetratricopeptide (TPR) repeat protein
VSLEDDGSARTEFVVRFNFFVTSDEQEQVRWYLEDYLLYPQDPGRELACRAETLIDDLGERLFRAVFMADNDVRELWATIQARLSEIRVEVIGEHPQAWAIPWELLRDPETKAYLALSAQQFVRAHPAPARTVNLPKTSEEPIRILLVIARPRGRSDVPFRSVARSLLLALSQQDDVQLHVLRPPTYEALEKRLREAKNTGTPFHVVHFDGHGAFFDLHRIFQSWKQMSDDDLAALFSSITCYSRHSFSPQAIYPGLPRPGEHGYLAFENPGNEINLRLVDGATLGRLLADTSVTVLVLNACQSAQSAEKALLRPPNPGPAEAAEDRHGRVRAFGSLAQEVMDAGVPSVIAMRYNIYVATAAQFVAGLYGALSNGRSVGEAVASGRRQLDANPFRSIGYGTISLRDWIVPVVFEAGAIRLFLQVAEDTAIRITDATTAHTRRIEIDLPKPPDIGFWGRDETLLGLDRAFDDERIVLLHAFAGSGKTATAAEFARWYHQTSGVKGPLLFTSFEQYTPLPRVLEIIPRVFEHELTRLGIEWFALDEQARRRVALQVLQRIPVLWIWDNVESVSGFPRGATAAYALAEQKALVDLLRDLRDQTLAKVLVTSRRQELEWLDDLPAYIPLPAMRMHERLQMANAIAEKRGRKLRDVGAWLLLLAFTEGNPLTVRVLVNQALHDCLTTHEQMSAFVERLRAGESVFVDEPNEGRSKSLGAALEYGFAHAFNDAERGQIALLHLFKGFVDAPLLCGMSNDPTLEIPKMTRNDWIKLLDRAQEVGLLEEAGEGIYRVHPALPWFFQRIFEKYCEGRRDAVLRTFTKVIAELGELAHGTYERGDRRGVAALVAHEQNLLFANSVTQGRGWWNEFVGTMQGLSTLCVATSRYAEWARLVSEMAPHFIDTTTDLPLQGMDENWPFFTQYRVQIAIAQHNLGEAERLGRLMVQWWRGRLDGSFAFSSTAEAKASDKAKWYVVENIARSTQQLAWILCSKQDPDCVSLFEEAISLFQHLGDRYGEAVVAFNIGTAYINIPTLRNLLMAEKWSRRSLELWPQEDRVGCAACLHQIGTISSARFEDANKPGADREYLQQLLAEADRFYNQALEMYPPYDADKISIVHSSLGRLYALVDPRMSLYHYRESLRYSEGAGLLHRATETRHQIAIVLAGAKRFEDALDYARTALRDSENLQERDSELTAQIIAFIRRIETERTSN